MTIDLQTLLAKLTAQPHCPLQIPNPASEYALTHILKPLRDEAGISFSELDFSAFTFGDLDRIADALCLEEECCERAGRLCASLSAAKPKAATRRCFC